MDRFLDEILNYFSLEKFMDFLLDNFIGFTLAIILILFYGKIKRIIYSRINKTTKNLIKEEGVNSFVSSLLKFSVNIILVFLIIQLLGLDTTGVLAIVSALGLVLGFAFKETIANVFGGLILLVFKPFKVGDIIEYNNYVGLVKKIEIYYTTLLNFNNEIVIIPNGTLTGTEIRNISHNELRRLELVIGVSYSSDIELVKKIILDVIKQEKNGYFDLEFQEPIIGLKNFGASSLDFDVKVIVKCTEFLKAKHYIFENLKREFDKNGIDIPFNIMDVYIKSENNNGN